VFGVIMLAFFASPLASKSWSQPLVVPLFVAFAAAGIFPLWKGIQLYGWQRMDELVGLRWVLAHGLVYLASLGPFMVCNHLHCFQFLWTNRNTGEISRVLQGRRV
jgi:predicted membrane channel-forming protein YqfA (hemolysin III family)